MDELDKEPSAQVQQIAHARKRRKMLYGEVVKTRPSSGPKRRTTQWEPVSLEEYTVLDKVGEGTYGVVTSAKAPSGMKVALKKINMESEREGFPITAVREIKILKALDHPNVLPLLDVITTEEAISTTKLCMSRATETQRSHDVFMVFEYMEHDLQGLMHNNREIQFHMRHIKYFMRSLFQGLQYIHDKCMVMHRDIKGGNILVSKHGEVKLADFGLAYQLSPGEEYLALVCAPYYRPPELLMYYDNPRKRAFYDGRVDVWSAACVFAEMVFGPEGMFKDNRPNKQLELICKTVGTPTEDEMPGVPALLSRHGIPPCKRTLHVKLARLKQQHPQAADLFEKLFQFNPEKRLKSKEVLEHPFFHTAPWPERPDLTKVRDSHEAPMQKEAEARRREARMTAEQRQQQQNSRRRSQGRDRSQHTAERATQKAPNRPPFHHGGGGGGPGHANHRDKSRGRPPTSPNRGGPGHAHNHSNSSHGRSHPSRPRSHSHARQSSSPSRGGPHGNHGGHPNARNPRHHHQGGGGHPMSPDRDRERGNGPPPRGSSRGPPTSPHRVQRKRRAPGSDGDGGDQHGKSSHGGGGGGGGHHHRKGGGGGHRKV